MVCFKKCVIRKKLCKWPDLDEGVLGKATSRPLAAPSMAALQTLHSKKVRSAVPLIRPHSRRLDLQYFSLISTEFPHFQQGRDTFLSIPSEISLLASL